MDGRRQFFEYMHGVAAVDRVHRVETQSVESIITQPHQRIVDDEAVHGVALRAVVIDGRAPGRAVTIGEIGTVLSQVVSVGTQVVVDDVEQYAQARRMAGLHEGGELRGRAVSRKRRVQVDAVIAPAAPAGKRRQWHELDVGDSKFGQVGQLLLCGGVSSGRSESAHVQLVDHRIPERCTLRCRRRPWRQFARQVRRPMNAVGLPSRPRIGNRVAAVDREAVAVLQQRLIDVRLPVALAQM